MSELAQIFRRQETQRHMDSVRMQNLSIEENKTYKLQA